MNGLTITFILKEQYSIINKTVALSTWQLEGKLIFLIFNFPYNWIKKN